MAPFGLRRIRARVFALLAMTLLPVLSLQVYSFYSVRARQIEEASAQVLTVARLAAVSQASSLDVVQQILRALSVLPEFQNGDVEACRRRVHDLAAIYPTYNSIALLSLDGTMVCNVLPESEGVYMGDRDWVRIPLDRGEMAATVLPRGRLSGLPVVATGYPVRDSDGVIRGVVGIGFRLDVLTGLGASEIGPGLRLELFSGDGVVVGTVPELPDFEPYAAGPEQMAYLASGSTEQTGRLAAAEGRMVAAFVSLGDASGLHVAVTSPESSILAVGTQALQQNLLLLAVVALISLWLATWGSRRFVEVPLGNLVTASRDLKAGVMSGRSPIDGPAEVRELSNAFNEMAEKLAADTQALAALNAALEAEVVERTRARERVQASERHLRGLIEAGHDMIAVLARTGEVLFASPSTGRILGLPLDEVVGQNLLDLVHPGDRAALELALDGSGGEGGRAFGAHMRGPDGSWRAIEAVARDLSHDPVIQGIVINARDVTDRETTKAEGIELLRRTSTQQSLLLQLNTEQGPDAGDFSGSCRAVSRAAAAGLDVQRAGVWFLDDERRELRCECLFDRADQKFTLHEALEASRYPRYFEAVASTRAVAAADARNDSRTSEFNEGYLVPFGIHSTLEAAIRLSGSIVGVISCEHTGAVREWTPDEITFATQLADQVSRALIARDREEARRARDRAEGQLRQAQKLETIGTMAGGIAHDFNNILTPIVGYSQMVLEELDPASESRDAMQAILDAAHRARELVQGILTFSRDAEQERSPVLLQGVVAEALELVRASTPANIEMRAELDATCPPVLADPTQVHQIVLNLCTNATHAIQPDGGRVTVSLSLVSDPGPECAERPCVRLAVADTGRGMAPDVRDRIFDPFFTTKGTGEGTGLGLSVVHGIVANHDAFMTVDSEPGKGSTLAVHFPAVADGAEPSNEASPSTADGDERVLFVDDEAAICRLATRGLGRLGYRVTTFERPDEALAAFAGAPDDVDVVVTDMSMPGMSGAQLLTELRQIRPSVRVILATGFLPDADTRADGVRFDGTLLKPAGPRAVADEIRKVMARVPTTADGTGEDSVAS